MAHAEQLAFVTAVGTRLRPWIAGGRVLEVGSYDVNGTVRGILGAARDYIGVDLAPGPGVDVVSSGHLYDGASDSFDLAISCECFEHNPYWRETFTNMIRVTRPGGVVAFTCASLGRLEHGTQRSDPSESPGTSQVGLDYYRNLTEGDFRSAFALHDSFAEFRFFRVPTSSDLYFVGVKKGPEADVARARQAIAALADSIPEIRGLRRKMLGTPRHLAYVLMYDLPFALLSRLLPPETFQGFALKYRAFLSGIAQRLRGVS